MADPQTENGYLQIAMEIVEALAKHRIPGQEMQLVWVLLRKTWGWKKKEDYIPLSQWAKLSGIKRTKCCTLINSLIAKNLIKKTSPQKGTPVPKKGLQPVPKRGTKTVPKRGLSIDKKIIKERAKNVILYLNETYNRRFRFTKGSLNHIRARLEEGFTEEDLKQVIDTKYNDEKFNKKYFRPATLFNSEKFEGYLNEKPTNRYT